MTVKDLVHKLTEEPFYSPDAEVYILQGGDTLVKLQPALATDVCPASPERKATFVALLPSAT